VPSLRQLAPYCEKRQDVAVSAKRCKSDMHQVILKIDKTRHLNGYVMCTKQPKLR
jgi:hypothetical protein